MRACARVGVGRPWNSIPSRRRARRKTVAGAEEGCQSALERKSVCCEKEETRAPRGLGGRGSASPPEKQLLEG